MCHRRREMHQWAGAPVATQANPDRRSGRVQGDCLVSRLHAGLRIGSECGIQRLGETWLELADGFEAGAELRMQCGS
jgi:hypothetical protein